MWILDKLSSLVSGMGGPKDKVAGLAHVFTPLTPLELQSAYRGSWIPRKVIDIPAFDMVREGRFWQAESDEIEKIEAEEKRLQVWPKIARALKLARLYGGSAIILGVNDGFDPSEPLNADAIRAGGLRYLHVVSRYELGWGELDRDPESPWFGGPVDYTLNTSNSTFLRLHPSRVVTFIGAELPDVMLTGEFWGDSVLQSVNDALLHAQLTGDNIASMVMEAKLDIYKIKGLTERVNSETYRNSLLARFSLANTAKSLQNALIVDSEEEYEQKVLNFAGLEGISSHFLQVAAGASDIPATRLLGQAPSGLNATGDSDVRNYYDRIGADQELLLRPRQERIDEVLIRSALSARPNEIHFAYTPLWQMSEAERSEIRKRDAETSKIYLDTGILSRPIAAKVVQNQLVESEAYPGLEGALDEARAAGVATFGLGIEERKQLLLERQANAISEEDHFTKLAEGGVIRPKVSFEQHKDEIETEGTGSETDEDPEDTSAEPGMATADALPKTLYVCRKVLNVSEIKAWATSQGIGEFEDDLHVTIAYSRTPVDWIKAGNATEWGEADGKLTIPAGGPRVVEPLGGMTAVLMFASSALSWRHEDIKRAGASFDYPDYQPHVSLTKAPIDLGKVEPYRGPIVFGPEVFEEIDPER